MYEQQQKKIDKWNYIRIENLYATKDTIKKVKECQQDGKNVFVNHLW